MGAFPRSNGTEWIEQLSSNQNTRKNEWFNYFIDSSRQSDFQIQFRVGPSNQ